MLVPTSSGQLTSPPATTSGTTGTWSMWPDSSGCVSAVGYPPQPAGSTECGLVFSVSPPSPVASQNGPFSEHMVLGQGTPPVLQMLYFVNGFYVFQYYHQVSSK